MGAVFAVGMMEGVCGVNWRTIARVIDTNLEPF